MSGHLGYGRPGFLWALLAVMCIVPPLAGETVLHNFAPPPKGSHPTGVIRDSAGNLYGTTSSGGSTGFGVVFKLDAASHETVLYSFTGGTDGANPYAGVIRDSAGNLYGTTGRGGSTGFGVVFKLDAAGHETVLYSFTGQNDGGQPYAGVIRDTAGNLYGTTHYGGNVSGCFGSGCGVVYKVDVSGHETVLYSFTGQNDGGDPYAGVIRDLAGNLYGTTRLGGSANAGVVYEVDATGHETVLYNFTGGTDGGDPFASVIRDSAGNLYGTTSGGGSAGLGVVYRVDAAGHETVLYSFTGQDGAYPHADMIRDSAGNLYGTTTSGGHLSCNDGYGCGVVYKVDAAGHETVLYSFTGGTDGGDPSAGVIRDRAGNLRGTAADYGSAGFGVVYKLNKAGHESVLHTFIGGADGTQPYAGVIRDSAGNLYGTTTSGGSAGRGVVYELDAASHETTLYSFSGGADGGGPYAGVIRDSTGNLYGTTTSGGSAGWGVVYKVDAAGHETVLYSFGGVTDGAYPQAGVIRDSQGNLYGTTSFGGNLSCSDGSGCGVVYKVDAWGHETVLYSFGGGTDGGYPQAGVIRDSAGNLYGTAAGGGSEGLGVVYKVDTTGQETVLYSFTGQDGAYPQAGVIRDSAGNLYGTTQYGGSVGRGVVYKVDASGQETVLYSFTDGADGGYPYAGVIRDKAGNLYGTTPYGGTKLSGVVFRIP